MFFKKAYKAFCLWHDTGHSWSWKERMFSSMWRGLVLHSSWNCPSVPHETVHQGKKDYTMQTEKKGRIRDRQPDICEYQIESTCKSGVWTPFPNLFPLVWKVWRLISAFLWHVRPVSVYFLKDNRTTSECCSANTEQLLSMFTTLLCQTEQRETGIEKETKTQRGIKERQRERSEAY